MMSVMGAVFSSRDFQTKISVSEPVLKLRDEIIYCIKNQQDATLALLFISNCKITLHVSDASCVHHQEY